MESDDETTRLTSSTKEHAGRTVGEKDHLAEDPEPSRSRRSSGKPPLVRSDEIEQSQDSSIDKQKIGCPDYFGVKSYLHHFYEARAHKDPSIYEDEDDFGYLLKPYPRKRRCTSLWWKIFVWIGANLLVFGIIGILVSYLVPRRNQETVGKDFSILDNNAVNFNYNLDICKLLSLVIFCMGGLTLTISLLFPSFLYHYCDDHQHRDESFKVSMDEPARKSPIEMTVPATCTKVQGIQPDRKESETPVKTENISFTE